MANNLRNDLVLKYLVVAVAGFIIIAISGFFIQRVLDYPIVEYLFIAVAGYWLLSFLLVTGLYQHPNINRNKQWFVKDEQGQLTLATWLRFAPLLATYKVMSSLRPLWQLLANYKHNSKAKVTPSPELPLAEDKGNEQLLNNFYPIEPNVYTLASPKLNNSEVKLMLQAFQASHSIQATKATSQKINIIVVDVASEVSSHYPAVESVVNQSANQAVKSNEQLNYSVQYVYLPLLDLQSLAEIRVDELLYFFQKIDQLITSDSKTFDNRSYSITLINFHCVMGLSRSIAIQTLYLVYCGKLNLNSYQSWLQDHYPQAHISAEFMPTSLIVALIEKGKLKDTLI